MRRFGVRTHELAAEAWLQSGRPVGSVSRDVLRRYRVAPPFWAVTIESDQATPTGYGVNTHGALIRYAQRDFPLTGAADGVTSVRTEYGPGCREMLARATSRNRAFVCETLAADEAGRVVAEYLVDAAMSQADGCGPLVIGVVTAAPQRDTTPGVLECSVPWRPSSPRSSTGSYPAGSSTKTTTSSLS